jgi:WD40 repeat protein
LKLLNAVHGGDDDENGISEGRQYYVTGEAWALCLSPDGKVLYTTTHDGRVISWDTLSLKKIAEIDTKGSFGTSIACVCLHLANLSLLVG